MASVRFPFLLPTLRRDAMGEGILETVGKALGLDHDDLSTVDEMIAQWPDDRG